MVCDGHSQLYMMKLKRTRTPPPLLSRPQPE